MLSNVDHPGVSVGYAVPSDALRPFLSTISHTLVEPGTALVSDMIYPEWGNVRFSSSGTMTLRTGPGPLEDCSPAGGIGPTSFATRFTLTPGSYWSVGLTPLGWARFIRRDAAELAERWEPVTAQSSFAAFAPLVSQIAATHDPDVVVGLVEDHVHRLLDAPAPRNEARIVAAHAALVDPAIASVSTMAAQIGTTVRTLERLSHAVFGFSPQLLVRRQRFLRSLSHYMTDPSLAWIETLDTHYVDQAHFIRDFRRFMGMTPRQYAAMPHPVMWAAAHARRLVAGTVMQVLQPPPGVPDRSPLR